MTRKELLEAVVQYTEAFIHNDPSSLKLAPNCKCTYLGVQAPLGSGEIWGIPRRIPYRQTFVDEITGNAVFTGVVTNNVLSRCLEPQDAHYAFEYQRWWQYYVRLKVCEEGICEIEEVVRKDTAAMFTVHAENIELAHILEAPLPEKSKISRAEMIKIGSLYWDGVQKIVDPNIVPIHPDARRIEAGTPVTDSFTAPYSVKTNYTLPLFWWDCTKRRYPVVDEDTGILISTTHMLTDEPTEPPGYVTDIFKIEDGMIKYIYAWHDWMVPFVDWEGEGPQTAAECE